MKRDLTSGILLIAGSVASMIVMVLHPTAHDLLTQEPARAHSHLNQWVHGLALAAVPVLFLGLLGLSRRLGGSRLATAALVAFGFGAAAVLSAAVASGFVATPIIERILASEGESRNLYHALLGYTGWWNQGFAKVNVVAWAVAILLWSSAILESGRLSRAAGVIGAVIASAILLAMLSGHLRLDVHGFGLVTFAQSGWLIWLGILLSREPPAGVTTPEP